MRATSFCWGGAFTGYRVSIMSATIYERSSAMKFLTCSVASSSTSAGPVTDDAAEHSFVFDHERVAFETNDSTMEGVVMAVFEVGGLPRWKEVKERCNVLIKHSAALVMGVKEGNDFVHEESTIHSSDTFTAHPSGTDNELLVCALLGKVAVGRGGSGERSVTRRPSTGRGKRAAPAASATAILAYSPLEAADVVALVRHCRVCPTQCSCNALGASEGSNVVYCVVVNRYLGGLLDKEYAVSK